MNDNEHQPASRLRTTLSWCAGIVLVGAILVWIIYNTEPTATRDGGVRQSASLVDVVQGEYGTFRPMIEAMGTVRPAREITLSARVEGRVEALGDNFEPGGFADAGELLVRIDDADYRAALRQSKSALDQAIADLEIEKGERMAAESEYRQIEDELPPDQRDLVLRGPQRRSAQARVEGARADVERAELNLERTTLEAPFDAHILSREVNVGSLVSPGTVLARLVGLETYWIEATVPVRELQWLVLPDGDSPGSPVTVRNRNAWPSDASRDGEVYRLIGELEGNTRFARILVAVDDPLARETEDSRPPLMLGEYVKCRIEARPIEDVVRIEREHIREDDTVWLMAEERLVIQPVDIVFKDSKYAYVQAGLRPDDQVVTTRLATVEEGLRLRLDDGAEFGE